MLWNEKRNDLNKKVVKSKVVWNANTQTGNMNLMQGLASMYAAGRIKNGFQVRTWKCYSNIQLNNSFWRLVICCASVKGMINQFCLLVYLHVLCVHACIYLCACVCMCWGVCACMPVCLFGLSDSRTQGLILAMSQRGRHWGRGCSVKPSDGTWSTCTLRWGCTVTPSHTEWWAHLQLPLCY